MNEDLGRISCNGSEEIRVSLQEAEGELYVEVRVSTRPAAQSQAVVPEQQAIVVPLTALSTLCSVLVQSQDRVLRDGLMHAPSRATETPVAAGEPPTSREADRGGPRRYNLTEPRVPVRLPVECYLLSAQDSSPAEPATEKVKGEMKDVSSGGAQVWLSGHFPHASRLAVVIRIGKRIFRGRAEVVGAASQPKEGTYRHNLRWLTLNDQAKAALSKLIGTPQ